MPRDYQTEIEALFNDRSTRRLFEVISWRILKNRDDADEAVSEAFCLALRFGDQLRSDTDIKVWMGSIVRNAALTTLRKRKHLPMSIEDEYYVLYCLYSHNPERQYNASLDDGKISKRWLKALQPKDKSIVMRWMNHVEYEDRPFTYSEKLQNHRALKKLKARAVGMA